MSNHPRWTRRSLLASVAVLGVVSCTRSGRRPSTATSGAADAMGSGTPAAADPADQVLRRRALRDEEQLLVLLGGCAPAAEPQATLRAQAEAHVAELRRGLPGAQESATRAPARGSCDGKALLAARRASITARTRDCVAASPALAPLLASLAAAAAVHVELLGGST